MAKEFEINDILNAVDNISKIERKNVSVTQKDSGNTFTLLAYINFAHEIYKDLHDQKRNAAARNLFNDTLKSIKKKTLNTENNHTEVSSTFFNL